MIHYTPSKQTKRVALVVSILVGFYLGCYHYTCATDAGITYNMFTGEVALDARTGHHFSPPWVLATKVDTRPTRVCIPSRSRNANCRLVRFNPFKYKELVSYEGFHYFWWYNRISFNSGQDTYRGVRNLLLGHAYGASRCECVEVISELGDE